MQGVFHHGSERKPFDTLCAPLRRYITGVLSPELLRVAFKEHFIKLTPETVDIEIFKVCFGQLAYSAADIACEYLCGQRQAEVVQHFCAQFDRVVVKLVLVIDVRHSVTDKQYAVGLFRVGTAAGVRLFPAKQFVIAGRLALNGHDVFPPVHYAFVF